MSRLPFACVLTAAALAAVACSSSGPNGSNPTDDPVITVDSPTPTTDSFQGATFTPAKHLPDVTLTDTSGKPWNLMQRGAGKVTIVYFGYTNCADVCPTDMAAVGTAVRQLAPAAQQKVQVVFVTVDPKRDTGAKMRIWLDRFDVREPDFVGLTGTNAKLTEAAQKLGLQFNVTSDPNGLEEVEHSSQMTGFDPTGTANLAWLDPIVPTQVAHDVTLLLTGRRPV
jgi:protein SCO1/2